MSQTELTIATAASKRLKMDGRSLLTLQSFVGNALNNLARLVSSDPQKRPYLMSDPDSTTATLSASGLDITADLATLLASPQIMIDALKYGTIFWSYNSTFVAGNVNVGTKSIAVTGCAFRAGDAIRFGNGTGALPTGLSEGVTYYVLDFLDDNDTTFRVTDTFNGTLPIDLADTGSGIMTVTTYQKTILQWLNSPNQGSLGPSLPLTYLYGWLQGTVIYVSGVTGGTLSFNSPFIPTLDTLPEVLESDLVDAVVQLAITSGFEPLTPAEK